ncbi:MAG: hypothetical protein ACHQIM_21590 [Sphingobacteriales bacterium]
MMNYNDTHFLIIACTISNIIAVLILWISIKKPKLARLLFFLLFGWACWLNYTTCHDHPQVYLSYAHFSIGLYKNFINGWFKDHITVMVSFIAAGQGLIALGMLLNGVWVKTACIGAILFLMAIAPFGIGSGFPFSLIVSFAAYFILRKDDKSYLWKNDKTYSWEINKHN